MDSLLFDTETIYYETTQKIAYRMNLRYNRTLYLSLLGQSDEEIHAAYYKRYQKFGTNRVAKFINEVYKVTYEIFE